MVKLKQVVMAYIELLLKKNTTNKLPSRFKGYADMKPHLLSEHDHQIMLGKLREDKMLIVRNMWRIKINTM